MIGLIGAMAVEVENLAAHMENRQEKRIGMDTFVSGRLFGQDAVLAVCGPGKINAALCTQSMIMNFQPAWVLNLGVAGAGESGVSIGDMVVAECTVQHDCDTSPLGDPKGLVSKLNLVQLPCDKGLHDALLTAAQGLTGVTVHSGVIATGDQFISDGERRRAIHALFGCKAVEMEGGAVAHACYVHGVPCGVLRSISDQADGEAEMDYPTFVKLAAGHSEQVVERLLRAMGETA
ncbi:MAG: 5'-methylthioadenosine/adenosylhomocysteine nucleosidase [Aristaeellaceae bacterium]